MALSQKSKIFLDRVSFLMILDFSDFDQVATAPFTDPIQVRFLLLRQSYGP